MNFPYAFGPYTFDRFLAAGGMAEVFVARRNDAPGAPPVAVKRMLREMMKTPEYATMFRDEAALCMRLVHPNIVRVLDFGEEDGRMYMAMELVEGLDLGSLLKRLRSKNELIGVAHALAIAAGICSGLHYAHTLADDQGRPLRLIHRDISPQNILLSTTGDVKITDFGIAKAVGRETETATGLIKGKVQYMAPEQALGQQLDQRVDQFAAGIVLWELLAGQRLFAEKSELLAFEKIIRQPTVRPSTYRASVPAFVDEVVLRALSKSPDERFADMHAFGLAIKNCLVRLAEPNIDLGAVVRYGQSIALESASRGVAAAPPAAPPAAAAAEAPRAAMTRNGPSNGASSSGPSKPSPRMPELVPIPTKTPSPAPSPRQPARGRGIHVMPLEDEAAAFAAGAPTVVSDPSLEGKSQMPTQAALPDRAKAFVREPPPEKEASLSERRVTFDATIALPDSRKTPSSSVPFAVGQTPGPLVAGALETATRPVLRERPTVQKSGFGFATVAIASLLCLGGGVMLGKTLHKEAEVTDTASCGTPSSDPKRIDRAYALLSNANTRLEAGDTAGAEKKVGEANGLSPSARGHLLLMLTKQRTGEAAAVVFHMRCVLELGAGGDDAKHVERLILGKK